MMACKISARPSWRCPWRRHEGRKSNHGCAGTSATPRCAGSYYIAGLFLINLVKAFAGATAAALVAWLLYSLNILPFLPASLPFVLVLILFAIAIGITITGLVARYSTAMQRFAWSITGLLMPRSCIFYPLTALPRPLHPIADAAHDPSLRRHETGDDRRRHLDSSPCPGLDAAYAAAADALFSRLFSAARSRGLLVKLQ